MHAYEQYVNSLLGAGALCITMGDALLLKALVSFADLTVAICSLIINTVVSVTLYRCRNIVPQIKILVYNLLLIQWMYSVWIIISRSIVLHSGLVLFPYYCNAVLVGLTEVVGISIGVVTCMAVDRMLAVHYVTWYIIHVTKETTIARCVTIWLIIQIFAWIPFARNEYSGNCVASIYNDFRLEKCLLGLMFFHCAFISLMCVFVVAKKIRGDRLVMPVDVPTNGHNNGTPLTLYHTPIVMFAIVVIVFFTCCPLAVSFLLSLVNDNPLSADSVVLIYADLYHTAFQVSYIITTTVFVFVFKESRIYFLRTFFCWYPNFMELADRLERKFKQESEEAVPPQPRNQSSANVVSPIVIVRPCSDSDSEVMDLHDIDIFITDTSNGHGPRARVEESHGPNVWN